MWTSDHATRLLPLRPLHLVVIALVVGIGLAGCGSSGSNEDSDDPSEPVAETFTVTIAQKTSSHPYHGEGDQRGFVVDGTQGKELTLESGETYVFEMDGTDSLHPFYITEDATGAGAPAYTQGVSGNGATGTEELRFTPPSNAPNPLYYQCQNHPKMGWRININSSSNSGGTY